MSQNGIYAKGLLCISLPWWLLAPLFAAISPLVLHSLSMPFVATPLELFLLFFPPPLVIL